MSKKNDDKLGETEGHQVTGANLKLEDILYMVKNVTDVDWFEKIVKESQERKEYLTQEIIEEGDIITMSKKCSSVLKPYIGASIVVDSVDRDGRYHVTLGDMETVLSRDKILLVSKLKKRGAGADD